MFWQMKDDHNFSKWKATSIFSKMEDDLSLKKIKVDLQDFICYINAQKPHAH
jgi:hypothetical protein